MRPKTFPLLTFLLSMCATACSGTEPTTLPFVLSSQSSAPKVASIKFLESGYHHVAMQWPDNEAWNYPWLIQRSKTNDFQEPDQLKHNQEADNTGKSSFRWLGINADNYVDLDGLEESTEYHYRVAAVTNMTDYRKHGAQPLFTDWIYGTVKTESLPPSKKQVYDVTAPKYGAQPNDDLNDLPAVQAAFEDAQKSKGGIVYFPAGHYKLWPENKHVTLVNNLPTARSGKSIPGSLFTVTADNITFLGERGSNGQPSTFIQLSLWHDTPGTQWLEIVNSKGEVENVRRYHLFILRNVENFTLKDLDIDGGAKPVNTGKDWYNLDQKRHEWDISNKLIATWSTQRAKNVIVDNVDTRSWRGEVYYNGGGSQKVLLKDGSISQTNSSSVSGSYDLELVNMVISDSANAAVESALFSGMISPFTNTPYNQNHIARGCTFRGLDQSDNGIMKDLPGKKSFGGWLVFNQKGTYQTVTDSSFGDHIRTAYGPWYESRNAFLYNCQFFDPAPGASAIFYTWTSSKKEYQLQGGMSEILWLDNELILSKSLANHQSVFYSQPGGAAKDSESPWIWEGFHIKNRSEENIKVNRFWVDTWGLPSGRQDAVFMDFTKDDTVSLDGNFLYNTKAEKIHPQYKNFFE